MIQCLSQTSHYYLSDFLYPFIILCTVSLKTSTEYLYNHSLTTLYRLRLEVLRGCIQWWCIQWVYVIGNPCMLVSMVCSIDKTHSSDYRPWLLACGTTTDVDCLWHSINVLMMSVIESFILVMVCNSFRIALKWSASEWYTLQYTQFNQY